MVKSIHIKDRETVEAINEIARIEDRRPHDVAEKLFKKSAKAKLAKLRKKK